MIEGMSKKLQELEEKKERALKKVKQYEEQLEAERVKTQERRRKQLNHAKFIVAGMVLSKAKSNPKDQLWLRIAAAVDSEDFSKYDRECLEALLREYEIRE